MGHNDLQAILIYNDLQVKITTILILIGQPKTKLFPTKRMMRNGDGVADLIMSGNGCILIMQKNNSFFTDEEDNNDQIICGLPKIIGTQTWKRCNIVLAKHSS